MAAGRGWWDDHHLWAAVGSEHVKAALARLQGSYWWTTSMARTGQSMEATEECQAAPPQHVLGRQSACASCEGIK